jgi:hypothetical protein
MRDPETKPAPPKQKKPAGPVTKADRLKAALKANMARRKEQAKARSGQGPDGDNKNE